MAETQAEKILGLAAVEVGYHEGKTGTIWNNFQKYSPEVPGLEWSQNQSWCATFVSWLAMKAGISDLYPRTASCDVGGQWFKDAGRWSEYPAIGAQVFYGKPSDLSHTGLVVNFDNTYIYTIEGNTNTSGSSQGDGVYRQKRLRRATNVIGYGYPKFVEGINTADPDPKWKKEAVVTTTQKTVFGIDASHYQFDNGFDLADAQKQDYAFVILKCTQGSTWFDNTYAKALAKAKTLGYLTGVYHFLEHGNATAQAQNLARHIVDKDLPVYIDIESSSKPNAIDWIAFRNAAKKLGLNVRGKYLTETYWHAIKAPSLKGPLVLWRAAYPTMNHDYGSVLYPGNNHARWNSFGGQVPTLWQFTSNGKIDGYSGGVDMNAFRGSLEDMKALKLFKDYSLTDKPVTNPPVLPKPIVLPKPRPPVVTTPSSRHKDFKVHLAPGAKVNSAASVKADMALVRKNTNGGSAVLFNTERDSVSLRNAVSEGLGKDWTRVIENENTIAYGDNWTQVGSLEALLLAKADPSMAHVSPRRYLDTVTLENRYLKGAPIAMKGTHLLSEANCIHTKVRGRAWREKMWPIQVNDVLDDVEKDHKNGLPVVLSGDFNTGVHFTGRQLFALLVKRFGPYVSHVHNGSLDHIFLISTDKVRLTEVGVEVVTNNASDHDMVSAMIRATVL